MKGDLQVTLTSILNSLNSQQAKAANIVQSNALVIAGPGTGKTKTLIGHIYNLVANYYVDPKQILAITFTRKAATELKDRLSRDGITGVDARTIDSLTLAIIRQVAGSLPVNYSNKIEIINGTNLNKAYLKIINELHDDLEHRYQKELFDQRLNQQAQFDFSDLVASLDNLLGSNDLESSFSDLDVSTWSDGRINHYAHVQAQSDMDKYIRTSPYRDDGKATINTKEFDKLLNRYYNYKIFHSEQDAHEVFNNIELALINKYLEYSQANSVMTHSQILFSILQLIDPNSSFYDKTVHNYVRNLYSYITVDEYQDTSDMQVRFIYLISSGHTFVVGDPNQSIYGFRGVASNAMTNFSSIFGNTKTVTLTQSYRSTKSIVSLVNAIEDTSLITNNTVGSKPIYKTFYDAQAETVYLVCTLHHLLQAGVSADEIAILSRTNSSLITIRAALKLYPEFNVGSKKNKARPSLNLMTIHKSKGLEFKYVFVVDIANGIFPATWRGCDPDEELRLFYVACSRASKSLTLCHIRYRFDKKANRYFFTGPSSFIERSNVKACLDIDEKREL